MLKNEGTLYLSQGVSKHFTLAQLQYHRLNTKQMRVNCFPVCLFVSRVRLMVCLLPYGQYMSLSQDFLVVMASLHELSCGGILQDAGTMIWYTLDLKQDCSTSCFPNSFVYVAKKYHENETKLTQMKLIKKYLIETHFL